MLIFLKSLQRYSIQECPENSVSFRQMQCSAKGQFSEYIFPSGKDKFVNLNKTL